MNKALASGSLLLTLPPSYTGSGTVSLSISDAGFTGLKALTEVEPVNASLNLTVIVEPVLKPPTLRGCPSSSLITTDEDQLVNVTSLTADATDLDHALALTLVVSAQYGSMSVVVPDVIASSRKGDSLNITGSSTHRLALTGPMSSIAACLPSLTYVPDRHFNGVDRLYVALAGPPGAGVQEASHFCRVRVLPLNDAPRIVVGQVSTRCMLPPPSPPSSSLTRTLTCTRPHTH